ncbi:gamma-glutamylcyclotransferase [Cupriavidus pauculus]|uniref:gamma-glutamylcyclotransferase n=1 Tax=Cupriavidus pauculus TaxID=82633 RepID=UPI000781BE64|nr:gamma-glutamylcyclotransferase [Cupriavidus pauculus]KAB0600297.1 gamma-glutamylcyclotransferase [Cupriavidus pauculus]MBY4731486.1 gamma-glutamylcyclotransferase [Cupriavidus pauculus]MCM3608283.1 gamma-glutamylcyclotransferase [Cupriavidus pauculus]UAL00427.1 gamma-glutamylcyclotransferase [Cupriavidus pauculus]
MAITRQDLEADRLRTTLCSSPVASSLLPEADVERSLCETLAQRPHAPDMNGDVWLFGYGSLIWNPMVVHTDSRLATVHGYHRGFYLYSKINRGTWDNPGLVLGLDRGGCCTGMVFRIPSHVVEQEFRVLWRREMMTGAYHPRWLRVRLDQSPDAREQRALAFVMNREHAGYAGRLPDSHVVACLRHACGLYGPAREYLHQTLLGLATHGVDDPYLARLWQQLQACDAAEAAAAPCTAGTPPATSASAAQQADDAVAATIHPHETV